jgi:hypothetical protein
MIRDILGVERNFAALSTKDLLDARDQYHWHLIHKKNVVGTTIGLYYIRKTDPSTIGERRTGRNIDGGSAKEESSCKNLAAIPSQFCYPPLATGIRRKN